MRLPANVKIYDIIHSQQMVEYMWKYTLHMQSTQIPCAVVFDETLDIPTLKRALNIEIKRNDCLRIRLFRSGSKIKEYFKDSLTLDHVPYMTFSTKEERDKALDSDASKKLDVFSGETFRVIFFSDPGGGTGIYLNVSHMIMDAVATFIFFKDLLEVYDSLISNSVMPKDLSRYEDIVAREQNDPELESKLDKLGKELEEWVKMDRRPFYCALNGPGLLDKHSRLVHKKDLNMPFVFMPVKDKTSFIKKKLTPEQSKAITDFIVSKSISPEWLIQLGFRIYLSKINRKVNDTLFWVLCPRRKTVKEKRCGGTLASPMPWREILPGNMSFNDAIAQLALTQSYLFRHSDVPFTTIRESERKLFNLTLLQSAHSMMFSYLPLDEKTFGDREYEYLGFNFGHYVMPLYTITTKEVKTGCYYFTYIHRLSMSTDDEVEAFHRGVVDTIMEGIRDPDKTIDEIMEAVK